MRLAENISGQRKRKEKGKGKREKEKERRKVEKKKEKKRENLPSFFPSPSLSLFIFLFFFLSDAELRTVGVLRRQWGARWGILHQASSCSLFFPLVRSNLVSILCARNDDHNHDQRITKAIKKVSSPPFLCHLRFPHNHNHRKNCQINR